MRNRSRADGSLTVKAGQSKAIRKSRQATKETEGNEQCAKKGDLKRQGCSAEAQYGGRGERPFRPFAVKSLLTSETIPGKRERPFSPSFAGQAA